MKNTDFLTKNLIAHRGYHDMNMMIPENSLAAFKRAIRYGYSIELDVHLLKDGNLVVFHDYNLKRVCGVDRLIDDCDYQELKKYNLFNTKEKIPLLKEVLECVAKKVPILIEIKSSIRGNALEQNLAKILDSYNGEFAIQSFSILSIWWFKKHRRYYVRGLLSSDFADKNISNLRKWIGKTLISDVLLKTDFVSYDVNSLPSKYVSNLKKRKKVIGWTIKDKKTYDKALKYCDGAICEHMKNYV